MPATPTDIALYTVDGVVVTSPTSPSVGLAIQAADPAARDLGDTEIPMFFDNASDAQAMLDEKFGVVSQIYPVHEGIELDDTLGLGRSIALAPAVPTFRIVDESRQIDAVARLRAYSWNMDSNRFSVEVLG